MRMSKKHTPQLYTHKIILGLLAALIGLTARTVSAGPAPTSAPGAKKLFPQITDGIYNRDNRKVMDCRIAPDGLTVTDLAWSSYLPAGKAKRWSFNQTPYTTQPLINYKFDKKLAGLQVTINVEIYDPANIWNVSETYQEILQLGGARQLDLPAWFHLPQNRLAFDFDEGTWFPSGWTLPKGKFACWEGAGKYTQVDRKGKHPMLDFGFTHVAENTLSAGGSIPPRDHQCRVFGDAEWLDLADGGNIAKWHNDGWKSRGERMKIVIPDFENAYQWQWNQAQFDKFRDLVADFKRARPDCLFGCWGVGVAQNSSRFFDEIGPDGRGTGVRSMTGAAQWRAQYGRPDAAMNKILDYCGLNFGNSAVYWTNGGNPAYLYAIVQEWEVAKLARPDTPNVFSTWIQTEFVDQYPLSTYRFTRPDGVAQVRGLKHQAPPSYVYAMSLFAHTRMDGAYCWETGNIYSEDPADAGDPGSGGLQTPDRKTFRGVTKDVCYYIKYFGFYNYHVLAMWQASQNKDIIEAATPWFMPEIKTSTGRTWRTGDHRYPSYCNWFKEPLVRAKFSPDGRHLLVIACNPYNTGVQTLEVKDPKSGRVVCLDLFGDYPVIKRCPL